MSAEDDKIGLLCPRGVDDFLRRFAAADQNLSQQVFSEVMDGEPSKSRAVPTRLRFVRDLTIDRPITDIHAKLDRLRHMKKHDFPAMRFG